MQLIRLELENWGPFFGEHSLDLSVSAAAPIVVFRGENGRGKTSILRALVWALYGQIKEQDGRTSLDVSRMVNIDAVAGGKAQFGVKLIFSHQEVEYSLYRTAEAEEERPGKVKVSLPKVDLFPAGGHPYPAGQIPDVINGILSREISDFFLFDGEMLNRFEERLREDRAASGGFVRAQVERALGLPFLTDLSSDLDSILTEVNSSIHQASRKAEAHDRESDKYRAKLEELGAVENNLVELRSKDAELVQVIADLEAQLSKVDEIKDAYHERKLLERELDSATAEIADLRSGLADRAESIWWLPMAERLYFEIEENERAIVLCEDVERDNLKVTFRIESLESQLETGVCRACGQSISHGNEEEIRAQVAELRASVKATETPIDTLRARRERLRRFANAAGILEWVKDQETDIRRLEFNIDKKRSRIRLLSEQLAGTNVEIDVLERNLAEARATKTRAVAFISDLEAKRVEIKAATNQIGAKLAARPGVNPMERAIQAAATEALDVVRKSFEGFSSAMRSRVETSTSDLFMRLTTEKEYSRVTISSEYQLRVMDHQDRVQGMISAGVNQILTMAFIGALGDCSVDEAPMVMDTPFGRLDVGHRRGILEWVSNLDRQVILFVQSGEYDPERDGVVLAGKIGREYTIRRLTPNRSEVAAA